MNHRHSPHPCFGRHLLQVSPTKPTFCDRSPDNFPPYKKQEIELVTCFFWNNLLDMCIIIIIMAMEMNIGALASWPPAPLCLSFVNHVSIIDATLLNITTQVDILSYA